MRSESIPQFAIVKEDSAAAFEETLNATIRKLSGKNPVVAFNDSDPLFARISYKESTMIPETASDVFELNGVTFRCEDCPAFSPILKEDGTEDKRVSYGDCEFSEYGRTYKNSKCCEHLFRMIQNGGVGLCWKK